MDEIKMFDKLTSHLVILKIIQESGVTLRQQIPTLLMMVWHDYEVTGAE